MILTAYVRRQILKSFALLLFTLTFIFGVYMLARYLAQAAEGEIPTAVILKLVSLRVLIAQEIILPTTFYFGVLIGVNRLFRSAEMVAMFACGFGTKHLLRAFLPLTLVLFLTVASLSLMVRPLAWEKFYSLKEAASRRFALKRLKAKMFYALPKGGVFFAQRLDHKTGTAYQVFIYVRQDGNVRVIRAQEASEKRTNGRIYLLLKEGRQYEFQEGGLILVSEFESFTFPVEERVKESRDRLKAWPTRSLWLAKSKKALAELQWRILAPLGVLVLACLGLALAPTTPRKTTVKPFLWAIFFFILYFYGMASLKKLVAQGSFPALPGLFSVPLALAGVILVSFWYNWRLK